MVTLTSAVVPPTAPEKVLVPAVWTASVCAPFTVPPKVMLPAAPVPLLDSVVAAPRFTASL